MDLVGGGKEIFSTHDVARVCRVTPMTVIRWIEEGRIPAFKTVGGHRRVLRADLDSFCRARGIPFEAVGPASLHRVLVVDADHATRTSVADIARAVDPSLVIEAAADAFEAGRLMAEFKPQLVFLDQRLPGVDALELCDRIGRGRHGLVPAVIVMTTAVTADAERAFRARGALGCLAKPPLGAVIEHLIRSAFNLGPRAGERRPPALLILDRDASFGGDLRHTLATRVPGCRVIACERATDGLLEIGAEHPDLIVLDLSLPDADPIELIRRLLAHFPAERVAIVGTVAAAHDELRERALEAGATDVLVKPFEVERLLGYLGTDGERAGRQRRRDVSDGTR